MKQPKHIYLNGIAYTTNSKCPACSGERDTGGRLEFRKKKNYYLHCSKCKYSIHSQRAKLKQEKYRAAQHDRNLGIIQTPKRKRKKLKVTKADKQRIRRYLAEQKAKEELATLDDLSWI